MKTAAITFLVILHTMTGFASKPTVSTESMVTRSNLILVAEVESVNQVESPRKNLEGERLPYRFSVSAKVLQTLRGTAEGEIEFEAENLTFEPSNRFILFLKKKDSILRYLDSPAALVEATDENIREANSLLKKPGE
jgi:hypothetical protein